MNAKKLLLLSLFSSAMGLVANDEGSVVSPELQYEVGRIIASAVEKSDVMALVASAIEDDLNDEGKQIFAKLLPDMASHIANAKRCINELKDLEVEIRPLETEFKEYMEKYIVQERLGSCSSEEEAQRFIQDEVGSYLDSEDVKNRYPDASQKIEKLGQLRQELDALNRENNQLYWAFLEGVKSVLGGASFDSYIIEQLSRHMEAGLSKGEEII